LVEVNGSDVTCMTHNQAVDLLRCTPAISRFVLKRSSALPPSLEQKPETLTHAGDEHTYEIELKKMNDSLGFNIVVSGLYDSPSRCQYRGNMF